MAGGTEEGRSFCIAYLGTKNSVPGRYCMYAERCREKEQSKERRWPVPRGTKRVLRPLYRGQVLC